MKKIGILVFYLELFFFIWADVWSSIALTHEVLLVMPTTFDFRRCLIFFIWTNSIAIFIAFTRFFTFLLRFFWIWIRLLCIRFLFFRCCCSWYIILRRWHYQKNLRSKGNTGSNIGSNKEKEVQIKYQDSNFFHSKQSF